MCKANFSTELDLCAIMNARSGRCPGDCGYCAQSFVSKANIRSYDLISEEEMLSKARYARQIGAKRVSIVTSGLSASDSEVDRICRAIDRIRREIKLDVCASLGMLKRGQLNRLKDAGLSRYHHNIETAPSFFQKIVSTHGVEDRIRTVLDALDIGFEVCCGGIFGIGESWEQRIEFFELLSKLGIKQVPINFLIPIKGTPLEDRPILSWEEALKIVFLARVVMPDACLRLCGGRELVFSGKEILPFLVGATAMMIGGYLTKKGSPVEDDHNLKQKVEKIWNRLERNEEQSTVEEIIRMVLT